LQNLQQHQHQLDILVLMVDILLVEVVENIILVLDHPVILVD